VSVQLFDQVQPLGLRIPVLFRHGQSVICYVRERVRLRVRRTPLACLPRLRFRVLRR
jgi:hypothetical protein